MILSVISLLMIILVAAFWTYQGLFSAFIMLLEAAIASMLAFGFHESVASMLGDSGTMRDIGPPLAMMLIFLVSLAVMRVLTDRLVQDAVNFPLQIDRAGAGVCGFLTGMIVVGTTLVAIQMFPFESSVLGFSRFETDHEGRPSRQSLMIRPDGFTLGTMGFLSKGAFGAGNPIGQAKPDLLGDLFWVRNGPQREAGLVVPPGCLSVQGYWETRQIHQVQQRGISGTELRREFKPVEATSLEKFLVCRVTLDSSAAFPPDKQEIRFRVPQFRVVGPRPAAEGGTSGELKIYPACGMSDLYTNKDHNLKEVKPEQAQRLVRFGLKTDFLLNATTANAILKNGKYQFDVVFEVPETFEPWYMEFKQGGRAELTKSLMRKESPGPPAGETASEAKPAQGAKGEKTAKEEKKVEVGEAPAGRTHVADAIKERTGATADLPVILDSRDKYVQRALRGEKLWAGHFYTEVSEKEVPAGSKVTVFEVPTDKRMVQVGAEQNMPESIFGSALNYAAKVAAQPRITTNDGTNYFAVGVYSAAKIGGKLIFEVQYWPEAEIPERCLKEAKKVNANVMKQAKADERKFGYIFLVDPGVEIVSFSTTGKGEGQKVKIAVPE